MYQKKQTAYKPQKEKGWVAVVQKHTERTQQTSMKERLSSIKVAGRDYVEEKNSRA